ncbi:hypothetical protein B0H14DRAFT_2649553 [Mycena olivaceomarginata]|nr:hypothetical protein B0H14DRAFT_2649553 [Mycena olivaceomarginata]
MSSDVESSPDEQQYNSEDERRCQEEWAEYELRRAAFDLKRAEAQSKRLKARVVQNKRDQWKAASARYYERHPEVKEKKRLKAAEQRNGIQLLFSAAKKLARRRWDPAPKRKSEPLGDSREEPDLDLTADVADPTADTQASCPLRDSREEPDLTLTADVVEQSSVFDPTPDVSVVCQSQLGFDGSDCLHTAELWASNSSDALQGDPEISTPAQVLAAKSLSRLGEQTSLGSKPEVAPVVPDTVWTSVAPQYDSRSNRDIDVMGA